MNKTDQDLAIAHACGWRFNPSYTRANDDEQPSGAWIAPGVEGGFFNVPAYSTSLNAMHDAETAMEGNESFVVNYNAHLVRIVHDANLDAFHAGKITVAGKVWHATAAQRAEAFLRTINKWTDD